MSFLFFSAFIDTFTELTVNKIKASTFKHECTNKFLNAYKLPYIKPNLNMIVEIIKDNDAPFIRQ